MEIISIEEQIHREPSPKMIISERKRLSGVPIVPGDPCCAEVCRTLNEEIEIKRGLLDAAVSIGGARGLQKSRTYRSLLYGIEALEYHRQDLKEKNVCRCIEDTGAVSIMVPLINMQKEPKKGDELKFPDLRVRMQSRAPERIRKNHGKDRSAIPPTNSCCPEVCKLINNEIDKNSKTLDELELIEGTSIHRSPKYESLSYRTFSLQEYRSELKRKGSCKCIE